MPLTRTMLSGSARATAIAMLMFLERLKTGRTSADAILKTSEIVVTQFKRYLVDMRIVPNASTFKKVQGDGYVYDVMTAEEYTDRVFHSE